MITITLPDINIIIIKFTNLIFVVIHLVFLLMFGYIKNPTSIQMISSSIIIYNIIHSTSHFLPIKLNFCCYLQTFSQLLSLFGLFFTLTTIPLSYYFQYKLNKTFNDKIKFIFQITLPLFFSIFLLLLGKPSLSANKYNCTLSISYIQYVFPSLITIIAITYVVVLILYMQHNKRYGDEQKKQHSYRNRYLIKSTVCMSVLFVYFQFLYWFNMFYFKEGQNRFGVLDSVDIVLRGISVFVLGMKKEMCFDLMEILCCVKGDDFHFMELETGPVLPVKDISNK